jgi:hypothetical protein
MRPMASAVVVNVGLLAALGDILAAELYVRLFANNVMVGIGNVLTDFQPAAFPGYADIPLSSLWQNPVIDGVGRSWSSSGTLTWTRGGGGVPETEYGWLLYQNPFPDSVLVAGFNFLAPVPINSVGETLVLTLLAYLFRG